MTDTGGYTRRNIVRTTGAAGLYGLTGCLGDEPEQSENGSGNRSQNETGSGRVENETHQEKNETGQDEEAADESQEMSLEAQRRATDLSDMRWIEEFDELPYGLYYAFNELAAGSEDALAAANRDVRDKYSVDNRTRLVKEETNVVAREWNLPSGDTGYTFSYATGPDPEGPYNDMSEIIEGETVTDRTALEQLSVAFGHMLYQAVDTLGESAPAETEPNEPFVMGGDYMIHDTDSRFLAYVRLYDDEFNNYVNMNQTGGADTVIQQLQEYAEENMQAGHEDTVDPT